jgi:hypothetical protein
MTRPKLNKELLMQLGIVYGGILAAVFALLWIVLPKIAEAIPFALFWAACTAHFFTINDIMRPDFKPHEQTQIGLVLRTISIMVVLFGMFVYGLWVAMNGHGISLLEGLLAPVVSVGSYAFYVFACWWAIKPTAPHAVATSQLPAQE